MNIFEKNIEADDIFEEVKALVDDGKMGSKLQIVRMFSAAKREYENMKLKEQFEERVGRKNIRDTIVLDENTAIVSFQRPNDAKEELWYQPVVLDSYRNVVYKSLEQALVGAVCLKTGNDRADAWINKMLGIDEERELIVEKKEHKSVSLQEEADNTRE